MTRRTSTCRIAVALVLATGLMSSAVIAGAATTSRFGVVDKLEKNAAIAPRFDPAQPTKLDEFVQDPNVQSVHFAFDRAKHIWVARADGSQAWQITSGNVLTDVVPRWRP